MKEYVRDMEKNGKRETERILKTQQQLKTQSTDNCFNEQDDEKKATLYL